MSVLIPERLEAARSIPLSAGGHEAPPDGETPCEWCVEEKWAWLCGLSWTDHPDNKCATISAFLRSFNDYTDQDGRDRLDAWQLANADRLIATAGDGHQLERGYLAADWAVQHALPVWLELAEAPDAAATVRALPPIVDDATARTARGAVLPIREHMYKLREERLSALRDRVKAAVAEKLKDWAAGAAGAAWAAWAAEAAGAAGAAGAAEAAEAGRQAVYNAVYNAVKAKALPFFQEQFAVPREGLKDGAFELLDRMLAVGEDPAK